MTENSTYIYIQYMIVLIVNLRVNLIVYDSAIYVYIYRWINVYIHIRILYDSINDRK